ncbi:increased DNA methylation 1-like [Cajanus cajan]|uniref:increased DNA methylation 1-like n=1 Tax=Cajanus cajan TaxID=3821 RepID=UPI0010FAD4F9|nr:increased DNA methylation 1-like [Cajanus cajan]
MEVLRSQRRPKESGSGEDQRQALYLNLPNNGQKDKILVRETKSEKVCSRNNETKKQLYVPGTGQQTVLSWLVDMGTLQPRERVYYLDHKSKKALLCGDIVGGQILCDCCYLIVSISEFEAHSKSKICDPLKNIYVGGGRSLLQCLAQTWSMQDEYACNFFNLVCLESDDQNDNICCDGCPSTFHERCLDIQTLPTGDWQCCPCKFCVKQKDSSEGFHQSMNNACRICGQRYHQSCLKSIGANTAHSKQEFLCGNSCKEV